MRPQPLLVALALASAPAASARAAENQPVRLTLVRHGEAAGDPFAAPSRPVHGFLSERGVQQAEAARRALAEERFDVAFSSPYGRALQTAEAVLQGRAVEIRVLPFLREWLPNPALAGAPKETLDEVTRRASQAYAEESWKTGLGEGTFEMYARIVPPFLAELDRLGIHNRMGGFVVDEKARGLSIVVFAHGGTLNVLLSHLLGLRPFPQGAFAFELTGVALLQLTERQGIGYPQLVVRPASGPGASR
ncbi:MAG TPA: histidine phosphatase family protein [Vicinamibacteria bacterium]|nr:histidine phosphatase family protein [Vicinamibacteria bacterium]